MGRQIVLVWCRLFANKGLIETISAYFFAAVVGIRRLSLMCCVKVSALLLSTRSRTVCKKTHYC